MTKHEHDPHKHYCGKEGRQARNAVANIAAGKGYLVSGFNDQIRHVQGCPNCRRKIQKVASRNQFNTSRFV